LLAAGGDIDRCRCTVEAAYIHMRWAVDDEAESVVHEPTPIDSTRGPIGVALRVIVVASIAAHPRQMLTAR